MEDQHTPWVVSLRAKVAEFDSNQDGVLSASDLAHFCGAIQDRVSPSWFMKNGPEADKSYLAGDGMTVDGLVQFYRQAIFCPTSRPFVTESFASLGVQSQNPHNQHRVVRYHVSEHKGVRVEFNEHKVLHVADMTIANAHQWCATHARCKGFTFSAQGELDRDCQHAFTMYFYDEPEISKRHTQESWHTYLQILPTESDKRICLLPRIGPA
jgi:hypothetical protein